MYVLGMKLIGVHLTLIDVYYFGPLDFRPRSCSEAKLPSPVMRPVAPFVTVNT